MKYRGTGGSIFGATRRSKSGHLSSKIRSCNPRHCTPRISNARARARIIKKMCTFAGAIPRLARISIWNFECRNPRAIWKSESIRWLFILTNAKFFPRDSVTRFRSLLIPSFHVSAALSRKRKRERETRLLDSVEGFIDENRWIFRYARARAPVDYRSLIACVVYHTRQFNSVQMCIDNSQTIMYGKNVNVSLDGGAIARAQSENRTQSVTAWMSTNRTF